MAELISLHFGKLVILSLSWHLRISLKLYIQRKKHLLPLVILYHASNAVYFGRSKVSLIHKLSVVSVWSLGIFRMLQKSMSL